MVVQIVAQMVVSSAQKKVDCLAETTACVQSCVDADCLLCNCV